MTDKKYLEFIKSKIDAILSKRLPGLSDEEKAKKGSDVLEKSITDLTKEEFRLRLELNEALSDVPQERESAASDGTVIKVVVSERELDVALVASLEAVSNWLKYSNKDEIINYCAVLLERKRIDPEEATSEVINKSLPFSVILPEHVNPYLFFHMFTVTLENHIIQWRDI